MLLRTALRFALALAFVGGAVGVGLAREYDGWGDTGWVYASKYECCNAAVALAQQYSATACETSGGVPEPPFAGARGSCSSEWTQDDDGNLLYHCYAEAQVWCR